MGGTSILRHSRLSDRPHSGIFFRRSQIFGAYGLVTLAFVNRR
ncbi:hypothetical protein SAMN05444170_2426 [Bradyrhizobium erythrophlei]|uniref:Uncharacterized protein n=1 Tax=Bradyrhizobium erythrophlei TaxID=1437360 RepID=A0A1M7TR48_9BRAD|nr:hypothetical protein SAMN05444170_2426 [Bradyrhizobium erythrophlei]